MMVFILNFKRTLNFFVEELWLILFYECINNRVWKFFVSKELTENIGIAFFHLKNKIVLAIRVGL